MGKRLTDDERRRRAEEKARKKREREAAREAKKKAEAEEKARKKREREEQKRLKAIQKGQRMKRKPKWLYWLVREQAAKTREHQQYLNAGRTALALGQAIRKAQQRIMAFIAPLIDYAAGLKTAEARLIWSREPWTPQQRTRYNWGKKQELRELWQQFPDGIAEQDPDEAAKDAKRKTLKRQIDHAKAINNVLEKVAQELAEDKQNAVTRSLERSYKQVYEDIFKELQESRRAIDADKAQESRIADARDYTAKGNPRRTAPETQIPRNMPRLGNYGESVIFGAPSPDQVKAVLNAEFHGKDYSARIWNDRDKLASDLKDMMQAAIINGDNSDNVAQKLAQRMGVEFSHAQRLVRTEMNRILNQATLDGIKQAGGSTYEFLAIEDSRTCKRCQKLNHKRFKLKDKKVGLNFPPIHPRCRCTIMARFEWEDEDDDKPTAPTPTPTDNPTDSAKINAYSATLNTSSIQQAQQKTIEGWLNQIATLDKAKAEAVRKHPTQANAQAAADAQDAAMWEAEAKMKVKTGVQKNAIQQGKPVTNSKRRVSGAIDTDPKTYKELNELQALAENLYTQQRKSTRDVEKIAKSTGWSVRIIEQIKDYIFYQMHDLEEGKPPKRFDASLGMIQSWRRMALGKKELIEEHDILLLKHEWLEMKIKKENPNLSHQEAHDLANLTYCYSRAEEAYNAKSKRISISERNRRKRSILPRK